MFEEITEQLTFEGDERTHVAIGGDMNAHISQFAEQEDARGGMLKEFASQKGLVIVNTTEKCDSRVHSRECSDRLHAL